MREKVVARAIEAREQMKLRQARFSSSKERATAFPKFDEYPLAKYDRGGPSSSGVATVT